jgi:hypothetical protein
MRAVWIPRYVISEGPRPQRAGERGVALVFVVLALSVLSVLAMTYLIDTTIEAKMVAASQEHHLALYSAEAGIQEVLVRLNTHDRSVMRQVNGGRVRQWIPFDTRTSGDPTGNPDLWRFAHNDGANNDGASGGPVAPGIEDKPDDWAEYDPDWEAYIWYCSQKAVDRAFTEGNHYATLIDLSTARPDGLVRRLLEYSVAPGEENLGRGLRLRWKRNQAGSILFTNGFEQFTAQQGRDQLGVTEAWPVIEILATGKFGRAHRRIVAEAANFPVQIPRTAVYSCGETVPTFVGSGNMTITGFDYPLYDPWTGQPVGQGLNGSAVYGPPLDPGQYPPVPALTLCCPQGPGRCGDARDETEALQNEFQGSAELYGQDTGDGDPIQIGEINVQALFQAFSYYISPGHDYPASDVGDLGDADRFYVSRITATGGTNVVHGGGTAGGVLLIDTGDQAGNVVRFNSSTDIYGLILAIGKGELSFNGSCKVFGSIFAASEVVVRGTAQVYYSSQAISKVQRLQTHRLIRLYEARL